MTYFKLLLAVGLFTLLNHCNDGDQDATGAGAREATPEQKAQWSTALQKADCIKGSYKGEIDPDSGIWGSFLEGWTGGDNLDVTVSVAHNRDSENPQVLFLIESKAGSICSSYGGLSYKGAQESGWFDFSLDQPAELSFSSGSSVGKIGTRGSVAPSVHFEEEGGKCNLESLEVSDIANSALNPSDEDTSTLAFERRGEVIFEEVSQKCQQVSAPAGGAKANGSAAE